MNDRFTVAVVMLLIGMLIFISWVAIVCSRPPECVETYEDGGANFCVIEIK